MAIPYHKHCQRRGEGASCNAYRNQMGREGGWSGIKHKTCGWPSLTVKPVYKWPPLGHNKLAAIERLRMSISTELPTLEPYKLAAIERWPDYAGQFLQSYPL